MGLAFNLEASYVYTANSCSRDLPSGEGSLSDFLVSAGRTWQGGARLPNVADGYFLDTGAIRAFLLYLYWIRRPPPVLKMLCLKPDENYSPNLDSDR